MRNPDPIAFKSPERPKATRTLRQPHKQESEAWEKHLSAFQARAKKEDRNLTKADVATELQVFTDAWREANPVGTTLAGVDVVVTFQVPHIPKLQAQKSLELRMIDKYVPFEMRSEEPGKDAEMPEDFPPVDGDAVVISEVTCGSIAQIWSFQVETEEQPIYSFERLVGLSIVWPAIFVGMQLLIAELVGSAPGKAPSMPTDSSLASASTAA